MSNFKYDWPLHFLEDIALDPEEERNITSGQARTLLAEITRLRAEVARMREALEEIERGPSVDAVCNGWWESSCIEMSELARAALDNSP